VSARNAAWLGWFLFVLSVLLAAAALVLNLGRPQYADLTATTGELLLAPVFLLFGWFGALIVARRPNHPIGWVLCAFGFLLGWGSFASEYAIYGLVSHPGAAPAATAVAWSTFWMGSVYLALLAALLVLFPSGRPLSPRWRWVLWLAGIGTVFAVIGSLAVWPLRGAALLQIHPQAPAGGFPPSGGGCPHEPLDAHVRSNRGRTAFRSPWVCRTLARLLRRGPVLSQVLRDGAGSDKRHRTRVRGITACPKALVLYYWRHGDVLSVVGEGQSTGVSARPVG
jgi:hypothetical protein